MNVGFVSNGLVSPTRWTGSCKCLRVNEGNRVSARKRCQVYASALEERPVDVSGELFASGTQVSDLQKLSKPGTKYVIRSARVDELDVVTEVRCNSFYSYLADDRYLYFQRKREIRDVVLGRWRNPNAYCLVAVDPESQEIVGTCDATINEFSRRQSFLFFPQEDKQEDKKIYVSSMAVRIDMRRRGIARTILNKVLDVAKTLGVSEVYLHVEWENKPAVWLYRCCGFERYPGLPPKWLRSMSRPEHTLMVKQLK
ncbi:hypothetical protein NDN08_000761 [Rhodosorus marinus]|uniref:N-acetyltransferase domain-containing protein n=1 Tax=Rhodosorus marinus TaxID=101924 RepID=A0AAV8UT21_9RHOD|nr:hypothetical protein NDN08_000761 [Rhodosorus marinus]